MTGVARPVFRFAPSPNGRLHLGHAYSALLNADLAVRSGGRLLLRIEDIDPARSQPDLIAAILSDLVWLGVPFEAPVRRQSEQMPAYRAALDRLIARGLAYPCFCSRGDIRAAARDGARDPDGAPLYPGTCRGLDPVIAAERAAGEPHTWRLNMAAALARAPGPHRYKALSGEVPAPLPPPSAGEGTLRSRGGEGSDGADRIAPGSSCTVAPLSRPPSGATLPRSGGRDARPLWTPWEPDDSERGGEGALPFSERQTAEDVTIAADPARWGDPVIARRDVPTSYHLAVVVDDAAQGVTDVVRGRDLEAATDLHVLLQALLGLPTPRYRHHALILGPDGAKLAKSKGSRTLADLRGEGATREGIRAELGFA